MSGNGVRIGMAVIITEIAAEISLGGRLPVPGASVAAAAGASLPPSRARRFASGATRSSATVTWVSGLSCPQVSKPGRFSTSGVSRPQRSLRCPHDAQEQGHMDPAQQFRFPASAFGPKIVFWSTPRFDRTPERLK